MGPAVLFCALVAVTVGGLEAAVVALGKWKYRACVVPVAVGVLMLAAFTACVLTGNVGMALLLMPVVEVLILALIIGYVIGDKSRRRKAKWQRKKG